MKRNRTAFHTKPRKPLRRTPLRAKKRPVAKKKPKKRVKPKPKRIKAKKTKLWTLISIHIRQKYADHAGFVTLVDTGEKVHWKGCDCGHLFHNGERNAQLGGNELWYYENNYAPQDRQGNRYGTRDSANNYMLWAIHRYGLEEVEKMRKMKQTYKLWTEEEIDTLIAHYEQQRHSD